MHKTHRLFLLALFFSITSYSQIPTNGLVAYYPFHGNANDSSGNGHNGTVTGATLTQDRFGNNNAAYYFNGTSAYISTPLIPPNIFSISFWFFDYGDDDVISPGKTYVNRGFFSTYSSSRGIMDVTTGSEYFFDDAGVVGGFPQITGSWVHAVWVSTGTNIYWYRNTQLMEMVSGTTTNATTIIFGRSRFDSDFKHCIIGDIRIYNRALDSAEIQALYHEGGWPLPLLTAPANNALNQPLSLNLTWDTVANAASSYEVQISQSSNFRRASELDSVFCFN